MNTLFRHRLILFAPVALSFLLSDKSTSDLGTMVLGNLFFGVPFWLAWWLCNGFSVFKVIDSEGMFSPPQDPSVDRWDYWGHQQRQQDDTP
jgi:hypothetical protein